MLLAVALRNILCLTKSSGSDFPQGEGLRRPDLVAVYEKVKRAIVVEAKLGKSIKVIFK